MAVSEATANAIEHAASGVGLTAYLLPDRLIVEIVNDGVFQPGLFKDDEHRRRGLGLPLMVSLADQVHVSRIADNKTKVSLTFFLEAGDQRDVPLSGAAEGVEPHAESASADFGMQEVENRYRNLLDLSPDAILVHLDGRYVFANPAAARLFGARSAGELIGKSAVERMHPDDREFMVHRLSQVLAGAVAPPAEGRMLRLDGTLVAVEAAGSRVEFGGRLAVQTIIRDITERKQAELALRESERTIRESEERYRNLFNTLIEGFCIIEVLFDAADMPVDFRFLETNPMFEEQTGLHDVQGKLMRELAPDHEEHWFQIYGRVALTGEPARFQAPASALGRFLDVSAFRVGGSESRQVGILFSDITARKRTEDALQETLERYSLLAGVIENASQPVGVGFSDGRLGVFNRAYVDLLGYSEEEFRSLNWSTDLTPPEWQEFEAARLAELEMTGESITYEKEYVCKDGSRIPVELLVHLARDANGAPLYYYSFISDLTERRRAEETLRESEQRFRSVLDSSLDGLYRVNLQTGRYDYMSPAFGPTVGRSNEEFTRLSPESAIRLVHPDDLPRVLASLGQQEVAVTGEVDYRILGSDGEYRWISNHFSQVTDAKGKPLYRHGVVRDISEQQRAAEELRRSEATLAAIFDATTESIWLFSPDGMILAGNSIAVNRIGRPSEEIIGKHISEVLTAELAGTRLERLRQVVESGQPLEFEDARAGRAFLHTFYPELDDQGHVTRVASFSRDVTEAKQAEVEREQLLQEEQELSEGLAAANEELETQYEEISAQAEELQAQREELAVQNEEIRVAHEELAVLYEHERENARLKDALTRVDQTLIASLEPTEILDRALENGARALGAERAVLEVRSPIGWEVRSVYRLPVELVGTLLSSEEASVANAMEEAGSVLIIGDATGDLRVNASTVARYGTAAALALPISYQNRIMGSLQFLYASGPHRFSAAEIDFGQKLAVSVALALENARLFEQQRSIAAALQQTILEMPAAIPHLRFSHLYRSATEHALVGGDFYDVFEMEDGSIALLVGDVSGHDINAARIATMVKASLVAFAQGGHDPSNVLALVNRLLLRKSVPGFTSLLFAVFQPESGMLTYCSAGHPELLVGRAGKVESLAAPRHAPLGVFSEWSCASDSVQLEAGDTLLFYTDGLTEARRDEELFGEERLMEAFEGKLRLPLEELPQMLLDEVLEFTGGRLQDDVAILAVQPLLQSSAIRS